jgi:hypothetical protein
MHLLIIILLKNEGKMKSEMKIEKTRKSLMLQNQKMVIEKMTKKMMLKRKMLKMKKMTQKKRKMMKTKQRAI